MRHTQGRVSNPPLLPYGDPHAEPYRSGCAPTHSYDDRFHGAQSVLTPRRFSPANQQERREYADDLNRSQGEIYIWGADRVGVGIANWFVGFGLQHGSAAAFDFFVSVSQIGEIAPHVFPHGGTGSQA